MKVFGTYIEREIEIDTKEDGVAIIPHKVLEKLADEFGVYYTFDTVFNNGVSAVFKCTATCDMPKRRSEAIGEASNRNLENEISKRYPSIMASKRAFDRAMIRLFGFDEAYSDNEIEAQSKNTATVSENTAPSEEPVAVASKKKPVEKAVVNKPTTEAPKPVETIPEPTAEVAEAPVVEQPVEEPQTLPADVEAAVDETPATSEAQILNEQADVIEGLSVEEEDEETVFVGKEAEVAAVNTADDAVDNTNVDNPFCWDGHHISQQDIKDYLYNGNKGTNIPYGDTWKYLPKSESKEYHISRVAYFVQHPNEIKGLDIDNKCNGYEICPVPVIIDSWHRLLAAYILGMEKIKVNYGGRKDVEDYLKGRRKTLSIY